MADQPKSIHLTMLPAEVSGWVGNDEPSFRAHRLLVGGEDVSKAVRAIDLHVGVGKLPVVTLDLVVLEGEIDTAATVEIPDKTHEALIGLGWTPPQN